MQGKGLRPNCNGGFSQIDDCIVFLQKIKTENEIVGFIDNVKFMGEG